MERELLRVELMERPSDWRENRSYRTYDQKQTKHLRSCYVAVRFALPAHISTTTSSVFQQVTSSNTATKQAIYFPTLWEGHSAHNDGCVMLLSKQNMMWNNTVGLNLNIFCINRYKCRNVEKRKWNSDMSPCSYDLIYRCISCEPPIWKGCIWSRRR